LYSKEREQYVQLLRKVQPSPHSFASACNLEQPSPYAVGMWEPTNQLPSPLQMVASVQGVRETDEATEQIAPTTNHKVLYRIGSEPRTVTRPRGDERGAQRQDEGDQGQDVAPIVSSDQKTTSALDVKRMQTELDTVFAESLDQGFVRIAEPEPHVERRAVLVTAFMAWSALAAHSYVERRVRSVECRARAPSPEPQTVLHVRVRSEPTAAQHGAARTAALHGAARTDERGALPELSTPVRETLPRRIRRMSTSMLGWSESSEKPAAWPGQV